MAEKLKLSNSGLPYAADTKNAKPQKIKHKLSKHDIPKNYEKQTTFKKQCRSEWYPLSAQLPQASDLFYFRSCQLYTRSHSGGSIFNHREKSQVGFSACQILDVLEGLEELKLIFPGWAHYHNNYDFHKDQILRVKELSENHQAAYKQIWELIRIMNKELPESEKYSLGVTLLEYLKNLELPESSMFNFSGYCTGSHPKIELNDSETFFELLRSQILPKTKVNIDTQEDNSDPLGQDRSERNNNDKDGSHKVIDIYKLLGIGNRTRKLDESIWYNALDGRKTDIILDLPISCVINNEEMEKLKGIYELNKYLKNPQKLIENKILEDTDKIKTSDLSLYDKITTSTETATSHNEDNNEDEYELISSSHMMTRSLSYENKIKKKMIYKRNNKKPMQKIIDNNHNKPSFTISTVSSPRNSESHKPHYENKSEGKEELKGNKEQSSEATYLAEQILDNKLVTSTTMMSERSLPPEYQSGIKGVVWNRHRHVWEATWKTYNGKRVWVSFRADKYGFEQAKKMAIESRIINSTDPIDKELFIKIRNHQNIDLSTKFINDHIDHHRPYRLKMIQEADPMQASQHKNISVLLELDDSDNQENSKANRDLGTDTGEKGVIDGLQR